MYGIFSFDTGKTWKDFVDNKILENYKKQGKYLGTAPGSGANFQYKGDKFGFMFENTPPQGLQSELVSRGFAQTNGLWEVP